jgi:hypothetical protein
MLYNTTTFFISISLFIRFMKRFLPFFALALVLTGCSLGNIKSSVLGGDSATPKTGDTVSVHYVGTLADGSVFDSSKTEGRTPLEFVIGSGSMIKGFEAAVVTMKK